MNNFVTVKTAGGLGNILFQVATGYSYAKRTNRDFILYDILNITSNHEHMSSYYNNLFKNISRNSQSPSSLSPFFNTVNIYREPSFQYNTIPIIDGNVLLEGYYQSEKYFHDCQQELLELFDVPQNSQSVKTCSIHIRRGDYLQKANFHPVLDMDYYNKAIDIINADKYIIVSDNINWCFEHFKGSQFDFSNHTSTYQDLILMSNCADNIIANSSFSWWGAWLNRNINKRVVAPAKWFGRLGPSQHDLYVSDWIII